MTERLKCERCGKRLSRKTARQIDGVVMCSTCMFSGAKPETTTRVNRGTK